MRCFYFVLMVLVTFSCAQHKTEKEKVVVQEIKLSKGWSLFQNQKGISGEQLSRGETIPTNAITANVPTTVLNALVKVGKVKDPYFSNNLTKIDKKQFDDSWWYVHTFSLSATQLSSIASLLTFQGINYKANIWLNGTLLSDTSKKMGAFNQLQLGVDTCLKNKNTLAIEVFKPHPGDFTVGFVDWAPTPPDENMGIWRPVVLKLNGNIGVQHTVVRSEVKTPSLNEARLTVETSVTNHSSAKSKAIIKGVIGDISFQKEIVLKSQESSQVVFNDQEFKQLLIQNPKLWWPNQLGEPTMHTLKLTVYQDDILTDSTVVAFGIRQVEDYINENGDRGYKVNGQPLLIKGGGWVDDLLLGNTHEYNEAQVQYAKDMGMNCIRFEGFWGTSDDIYSLCDQYGVLAMVGWSCHWEWEEYLRKKFDGEANFGGIETKEEQQLVANYFEDQVLWLRNHPSIFVWTFGSDFLHRPALEKKYLETLEKLDPNRPYLGAAKEWTSTVTGPTGVKMEGPYDWVPPVYWYTDTVRGGAYGFNTETGPGPQPPHISSIKRMLPKENWWPIDSMWDFHSGRHAFQNMDRYLKATYKRYWEPTSLEEFHLLSQLASYEAIRPMFESFEVNKPKATGVVQWMLNSAWPETFWQLYDYYLVPTGAYFGTKKACQPVNVIYNYGDQHIYITNATRKPVDSLQVKVDVYDLQSRIIYQNNVWVSINENESKAHVNLVDVLNKYQNSFINLTFESSNHDVKGSNFYWCSAKKDVPDPKKENASWIYTPTVEYANFSALQNLPQAKVEMDISNMEEKQEWVEMQVELKNTSNTISFFNELSMVNAVGEVYTDNPIFYSDNYLSIAPNSTSGITIRYKKVKGENYELKRISLTD